MRSGAKGFTLIELLIVVAIIGILASIAIPNLMNAVDKSKQKRTMSNMRSIGTAIEMYAIEVAHYPVASDVNTLQAATQPVYMAEFPLFDGWNHAFQVDCSTTEYTVFSVGKDGTGTNCTSGATSAFNDQICFTAGQFVRFPDGPQQ